MYDVSLKLFVSVAVPKKSMPAAWARLWRPADCCCRRCRWGGLDAAAAAARLKLRLASSHENIAEVGGFDIIIFEGR